MDTNGVQGIEADLTDHHSLHEAMEGVDAVYNLASPMPGSDSDFLTANTEGLLNLLDVASESGVKVFVHLSTLDVYGFGSRLVGPTTPFAPSNDYQKSKAEAERLLGEFSKRNAAPRVLVIRAAKAVGSRDESLVVPVLRMAAAGKVVIPSEGPMSFTHPRDIAQAMFRAATGTLPTGTRVLLKSFDSTPEELGRGIVAAVGAEAVVKKPGLMSGTSIPHYTVVQLRASMRIDEQAEWKALGYTPAYGLKNTCEDIATWYKKEPWVAESG